LRGEKPKKIAAKKCDIIDKNILLKNRRRMLVVTYIFFRVQIWNSTAYDISRYFCNARARRRCYLTDIIRREEGLPSTKNNIRFLKPLIFYFLDLCYNYNVCVRGLLYYTIFDNK
jgi:hypothetical protein